MKNYLECTGCNVCQVVCPHNAIEIVRDKTGFLYPRIDELRCTKCGLCNRACDKPDIFRVPQKILCIQCCNPKFLLNATSGGIIVAIAEKVISQGGSVVGIRYDSVESGASWEVIDNISRLPVIQGSKYFQVPLTKTIYETIKQKTKTDKMLFIGTPCQVAAVTKVVNCNNLITIDLICGGVASALLENKYIKYMSERKKETIKRHHFRKKVSGWSRDYYACIEFQSGAVTHYKGYDDLFNYAYNSGNCMRESCYNCQFTKTQRVGDFTVGDAWGKNPEEIKEFDARKGISLVLVNSDKAARMLVELDNIVSHVADESLLKMNKPLNSNLKRRKMRSFSYFLLNNLSFKPAVYLINYRHTIKKFVKDD